MVGVVPHAGLPNALLDELDAPKGDGEPNAEVGVVVPKADAGDAWLPKTDFGVVVGVVDVGPPKADGPAGFGGLKNGYEELTPPPKAPNPLSSFENPAGFETKFANAPVEGPGVVVLNGELAKGEAVGVLLASSLTGVTAAGAGLDGKEAGASEGVGGVVERSCGRSKAVIGLGGSEAPKTEEPAPPNGLETRGPV